MATEKRLIDANSADPRNLAFLIHADGSEYSPYERGYNDAVISCYGLLMNAPTVDAVEVVRCEKCIHSGMDGWFCGGSGQMPPHRTYPDEWCSCGERITENG